MEIQAHEFHSWLFIFNYSVVFGGYIFNLGKEIIYTETNNQLAFAEQFDDAPILSFTINYRKNKPNHASTWSLKVLNAAATEEFVNDFYNLKTNQLDWKYDGIFIPNLSWKIGF